MKTSNKILIITSLVIAVILLASIIGSRFLLSKYTDSYDIGELDSSNIEKEYNNIIDFTGLNVTGDWDITLISGNTFNISINGKTGLEDPYTVEKKGSTLFLTGNPEPDINRNLTVNITMPEIKEVYSKGGLKLELIGFIAPELLLNLNGGSWIEGSNCEFNNFYLTSVGAINLDFDKILTNNTDLQLGGAGNIILSMGGGSLTGNVSGAMNIEYSGNPNQSIIAAGLTDISRKE
jgi:hypothetical protein